MSKFLTLCAAFGFALLELSAPVAAQRFDYVIRTDFFAGFSGDAARLQKAMALCESILADDPKHAEAMVWHGSGLVFMAGQSFQTGDAQRGMELFQKGLGEMNAAVALQPDNVAVLIPRGAVLLQATRGMAPAMARPLVEQSVGDYEKVLAFQAPVFATLGDHPRGELLFGLAEGSARLGRLDKARIYFERLATEVPGSGQSARARQWLAEGTLPPITGAGCIGCHKP